MSDQKSANVPRGTIQARESTASKISRIANMRRKSFAFRLGAILASDNRPGITWGAKV